MNRTKFLSDVTDSVGSINSGAATGFQLILDEAQRRGVPNNDLAYILATAWWETAKTMQPVREAFFVAPNNFDKAEKWRKNNLHYYPYYGRGYVQLTWKANYKKASDKFGVDFVSKPDEVMETRYAIPILFDGMAEGWFTGRRLDDYIDDIDEGDNKDLDEYIRARRIINGTDKANTIGRIALSFERALRSSDYSEVAIGAPALGAAAAPSASTGETEFEAHINALGLRYFKPYEFLVKGGKHSNPHSSAYQLNTDPPKGLWVNINKTAQVIDELRHRLQRAIVLSSVYRSEAYNQAIGGAADSQHKHFRAIDFSVRGSPVGPSEWANALRDMRSAGFFKGGIGVYPTFVHVDTRGENADWIG